MLQKHKRKIKRVLTGGVTYLMMAGQGFAAESTAYIVPENMRMEIRFCGENTSIRPEYGWSMWLNDRVLLADQQRVKCPFHHDHVRGFQLIQDGRSISLLLVQDAEYAILKHPLAHLRAHVVCTVFHDSIGLLLVAAEPGHVLRSWIQAPHFAFLGRRLSQRDDDPEHQVHQETGPP